MRNEKLLQSMTEPKPFPKGLSEAEMAAKLARRHTIASLAAGVKKTEEAKGLRS
jgi:hypothetical protein